MTAPSWTSSGAPAARAPGPRPRPGTTPWRSGSWPSRSGCTAVAREALGDGYERFLDDYFLGFLPALLRTAAEHEGLDQVQCDEERALVDEIMQEKQGLLAHSSILFPLNRQMFADVPHARPALDLGIGNACSSAFALDRTVDVGADIIHSNLVKARSRGVHEQVVSLDMGAIPYLDDTFARVYSLNAIYHVQEGRRKALEEMVRVLAPGGTLAFTDVSPFLQEMKPLATFFSSLGFTDLAGRGSQPEHRQDLPTSLSSDRQGEGRRCRLVSGPSWRRCRPARSFMGRRPAPGAEPGASAPV